MNGEESKRIKKEVCQILLLKETVQKANENEFHFKYKTHLDDCY